MTQKELKEKRKEEIKKNSFYSGSWCDFDYKILNKIMNVYKNGEYISDAIIMFDTETSKSHEDIIRYEKKKKIIEQNINYVVAWSIAIRWDTINICVLYGQKPSECIECIEKIKNNLDCDSALFYAHNLAYDWQFLRKFFINKFDTPIKQLNTRPHYPINIVFSNGVILRDSLVLAQRGLERWSNDLDVEHKKALGQWDYNKIRHQKDKLNKNELLYIYNDVLAGVECLHNTMLALKVKSVSYLPYTATGIPRKDIKEIGKKKNAHHYFKNIALEFDEYKFILDVAHGGYVHCNRFYIDDVVKNVTCYDITSSYPFTMLVDKYPMSKFYETNTRTISKILENSEKRAYFFEIEFIDIIIKDINIVMPFLQYSKAIRCFNYSLDNGRVLKADYIKMRLTEIDLLTVIEQYNFINYNITICYRADKDYLPRWFTDYIYKLFYDKCTLKNVDDLLYMIQKGKLNSCFGMCYQKSIHDDIKEDYISGENIIVSNMTEDNYIKYMNKYNSMLPYQWGVYVASLACRRLFEIGRDCLYSTSDWIYSDTDSIYATRWNDKKIKEYNNNCLKLLQKNNYDKVVYNGKNFILGTIENDGFYTEFKSVGAKRYVKRKDKNILQITVAGVPKKNGAKCLKNDINNFKAGFIFDGETTNKLLHTYGFIEEITKNKYGDELGDYINLTKNDYKVSNAEIDILDFFEDIDTVNEVYNIYGYNYEDR